MGKSILDQVLSKEEDTDEIEQQKIEMLFGHIFSECAECQNEWAEMEAWFKEHKKPIAFHWTFVCCYKHANLISEQIRGYSITEHHLIEELLDQIIYLTDRIDVGQNWMNDHYEGDILPEESRSAAWKKAEAAVVEYIKKIVKVYNQMYEFQFPYPY